MMLTKIENTGDAYEDIKDLPCAMLMMFRSVPDPDELMELQSGHPDDALMPEDFAVEFHFFLDGSIIFNHAKGSLHHGEEDRVPYLYPTQVKDLREAMSEVDRWTPTPIPDYGDRYSQAEFRELCRDGVITSDDGSGYYTKGSVYYRSFRVSPVIQAEPNRKDDPAFDGVVWFNK